MSILIKLLSRLRVVCMSLFLFFTVWGLSLSFMISDALAAGGKPATKLVSVADTRALPPGFSKWIADMYNTNLWLYALLVVVIMAGLGLILGMLFDRVMGLLGIHLGKLEHHE